MVQFFKLCTRLSSHEHCVTRFQLQLRNDAHLRNLLTSNWTDFLVNTLTNSNAGISFIYCCCTADSKTVTTDSQLRAICWTSISFETPAYFPNHHMRKAVMARSSCPGSKGARKRLKRHQLTSNRKIQYLKRNTSRPVSISRGIHSHPRCECGHWLV